MRSILATCITNGKGTLEGTFPIKSNLVQSSDPTTEKELTLCEDSEHAEQVLSANRGGRFQWLISPENPQVLLPVVGLWILLLDWILFSSNALSAGIATPVVIVLGFLLGSAGTYFLQRRFVGDAPWKAFIKAAIAGICVGMPWPLGGTLVGGWILLFSGLGNAKSDNSRKQ
jgi:hypothetical protein